MGTSGSYGGPGGKNPLIPSWLDGGGIPPPPLPPDDGTPPGEPPNPPIETPPAPHDLTPRFQTPRTNLTRFVSSGGSNGGALRRAVSGYVSKASGGPTTATRRMGSSRTAAGRLLSFLGEVQRNGVAQALQLFNLGNLAQRPIEEIFFGLADKICPTNGSVDGGIALDAFTEMIVEVVESGLTSLDSLTNSQIQTVFESYVANSIFDRLLNDIGNSLVRLSKDAKEAQVLETQIKDYIRGAVRDSVAAKAPDITIITQAVAAAVTDDVYKQAFTILESMGDS